MIFSLLSYVQDIDETFLICQSGVVPFLTLSQEDGEKIGLSMKVVNQSTGRDEDPNQVQTE